MSPQPLPDDLRPLQDSVPGSARTPLALLWDVHTQLQAVVAQLDSLDDYTEKQAADAGALTEDVEKLHARLVRHAAKQTQYQRVHAIGEDVVQFLESIEAPAATIKRAKEKLGQLDPTDA